LNIPQAEAIQTQSLCPVKELLENGNIRGAVTAVSLSYCKSYAATVGEDKTVRVWEFVDRYQFVQTMTQKFGCDLYDIALNPAATQLALGSSEGVKVYNVIATEELKLAIDVSGKSSFAVQYSTAGHLLAAGFGSQVLIIDSATLETKHTLGPHRYFVLQINWSDSDLFVASGCKGGSMMSGEIV
jgi:WD40 repeat protein